jgi:hypothetical protein
MLRPDPNIISRILVTDYASGQPGRYRDFERNTEIIGALRDGRVFLAQQKPGSRTVSIIEWHYLPMWDYVRTRARLTTSTKALTDRHMGCGGFFLTYPGNEGGAAVRVVSPDGRYIILGLGPLIGSTADIWAIDLKTGRSKVALPAIPEVVSTVWKSDHVLLGTVDGAFQINLRTLDGGSYTLPDAREARR